MSSRPDTLPSWLGNLLDKDHRTWASAFALLILLGAVVFWAGISGSNSQRTWQVFLINFLFWTGLSFGAVLFGAILNMTNAQWARPFKRVAEAPAMFLPFSLGFFALLYLGREEFFHWIHEPVHGKEWWLQVNALFARDGLALLLLTLVSLAMVYCSIKSDVEMKKEGAEASGTAKASRYWKIQVFLSPVYGILYAVVLTLIAIDLIMALDAHWVSTLFGAYYFMGSFYTALAFLFFVLIVVMRREPFKTHVHSKHMHDMGKLLLGFCLVTGDFFYSQFLVIWYGNLPEETRYVILRVQQTPWKMVAWIVLAVCFVIPFLTLLNRRIKMKPFPMLCLTGFILVGMWLERLLLVAPSLWQGGSLPLGFQEVAITLGFAGLMALCLMFFLRAFPPLPLSDPLFQRYLEKQKAQE